jgi:alkaline phosphatase/alkaline phosphatase D
MGWGQFMDGYGDRKPNDGPDKLLGYPALVRMQAYMDSHFVIGAGDLVYYDTPRETMATTLPQLRIKWQQQFALPRLVQLVGSMGAYWMKDDHDFRYDDGDLTGPREPSAALGIRTFKEQMPVVPPEDFDRVTYRTVRASAHVQLWFLEGRDYRSSNQMDDGPAKTIWGREQKQWLQRTLRESDAKWKLIITPTPMVGPDMDRKRDNHTNTRGFRHEGTQFFGWLKESGLKNVVLFTGDRHWQYHSIHSTGVSEFSCGSLGRENAVGDPPRPGAPGSTDPDAQVKQPFVTSVQDGGFLRVRVGSEIGLRVELINQAGVVLYEHKSKPQT